MVRPLLFLALFGLIYKVAIKKLVPGDYILTIYFAKSLAFTVFMILMLNGYPWVFWKFNLADDTDFVRYIPPNEYNNNKKCFC